LLLAVEAVLELLLVVEAEQAELLFVQECLLLVLTLLLLVLVDRVLQAMVVVDLPEETLHWIQSLPMVVAVAHIML
jgi:hypothetical protein